MTESETAPSLSLEKVLLIIGSLETPDNEIRQGRIAKALSNGEMVKTETIKPFIEELQTRRLIIKVDGHKKYKHTKPVPVIILTSEGWKMINRLKALQTQEIKS